MLVRVITGVTGDVPFPVCFLAKVRVAGTAALAGAVQIKQGSNVLETLAIGTAVGVEREYAAGAGATKFDSNLGILNINMASAADTVLVIYN